MMPREKQKNFIDQIFPHCVQGIQTKFSHFPIGTHISKEYKKREVSNNKHSKGSILTLYPVQHHVEDADAFNVKRLIPNEEARARMVGLVEKQKKDFVPDEIRAINFNAPQLNDINIPPPLPPPPPHIKKRSLHNNDIFDFMKDKKNVERNASEDALMKRKIVQHNNILSCRASSSPCNAAVKKKRLVLNSCNNSSSNTAPVKDRDINKAPEAKKELKSKIGNIRCWRESRKLINHHLQHSKPVMKTSPPPVLQPRLHVRDRLSPPGVGVFLVSTSEETNKGNSKEGAISMLSMSNESNRLIDQDAVPHEVRSKADKSNFQAPEEVLRKRNIPIAKVSAQRNDGKLEKRKNYDPEEIRTYIAKKRMQKKRQDLDQVASEKKKREERQQTLFVLSQHQKEAFQKSKRVPGKSKHDVRTQESSSPTSWEEIFASIGAQQQMMMISKQNNDVPASTLLGEGVKPKSLTCNTSKVHSVASDLKDENRFQYDIGSDVKFNSSDRLQKIQKSAILLASKLDVQASELMFCIKGKSRNSKSFKELAPNSSSADKKSLNREVRENSIQVSSSLFSMIPKEEEDGSHKAVSDPQHSTADNAPSKPPAVPVVYAVSSPCVMTQTLRNSKRRDYFRVPDDLQQFEDSLDDPCISFGTSEVVPRELFPSEVQRKKMSRRADVDGASVSKSRLSFGADDTFEEFNAKLLHSFMAEGENREKYQTSLSKIKRWAMEEDLEGKSNVDENTPRVLPKRGSDDVYPQHLKKMTDHQGCPDMIRDKHSPCASGKLDISVGQMFSDTSESSQMTEDPQRKRSYTKVRKAGYEFNVKLGEKYLTKKEQVLRQRKERVVKLLKRFEMLSYEEQDVKRLEMQASEKFRDFSDTSKHHEKGNESPLLSSTKLISRETAVQTNPVDCVDSATLRAIVRCEEVHVGHSSTSYCRNEGGVGMNDKREGINIEACEGFDIQIQLPMPGLMIDPVATDKCSQATSPIQMELKKDEELCRNHTKANEADALPTQLVGAVHEDKEKITNVCPKISQDSLGSSIEIDSLNEKTKLETSANHGQMCLKGGVNGFFDHRGAPATGTASQMGACFSPVRGYSPEEKYSPGDVSIIKMIATPADFSLLRTHILSETQDDATPADSETNSSEADDTIDSDNFSLNDRLAEDLLVNPERSRDENPAEKSKSSESNISRDSLGTLVCQTAAPQKPSNDCLCLDDISLHESDNPQTTIVSPGRKDSSEVESAANFKVFPKEELELEDLEEVSSEKVTETTTESRDLVEVIRRAAEAVEHFTEVNSDAVRGDGNHLQFSSATKQLVQRIQEDDDHRGNSSMLGRPSPFAENLVAIVEPNASKLELHEYLQDSLASELLQDALSAIFEARKRKKSRMNKPRGERKSEEFGRESRFNTIPGPEDEWLEDDYFSDFAHHSAVKLPGIVASREADQLIRRDGKFYVPRNKEDLSTMISELLDVYWTQRRNGESWEKLSPQEWSAADKNSTPVEIVYRTFLFELVGEVLTDLYSGGGKEDENQITCSITKFLMSNRENIFRKRLPNTLEELKPPVVELILSLLPPQNEFILARPTAANKLASSMGNKSRMDGRVESLLACELRLEEPDWINYEGDLLSVKNCIADDIFKSLLDDTLVSVRLAFGKKAEAR